MKLLLDANLSWRLAEKLQDIFPGTIHVNRSGIPAPASDVSIWEFARRNNFIIVTNDEDYLRLSLQKGFPPDVI